MKTTMVLHVKMAWWWRIVYRVTVWLALTSLLPVDAAKRIVGVATRKCSLCEQGADDGAQ